MHRVCKVICSPVATYSPYLLEIQSTNTTKNSGERIVRKIPMKGKTICVVISQFVIFVILLII